MDEIETTETATDESFALILGKTFVVSAATTAGTFAGLLIVGAIYKTVRDRKSAKTTDTNKTK